MDAAARERWVHRQMRPAPRRPGAQRPLASRVPSGRRRGDAPSPPGSAKAGESHFLCLSVPASDRSRAEAGDITQLPWHLQSSPAASEDAEPRLLGAQGPGTSALPRLPSYLGGGRGTLESPHPQEPPRYNRPAAAPHLLLGPVCRSPTDPPGHQGQGGHQQQQAEGVHDAQVPAACHLSWALWAPVSRAAGGHEPGNARPSPSPFSTLGSTAPASPSPPGRRPTALRRPKPQLSTTTHHLSNPGSGLSGEAQASESMGTETATSLSRRGRKEGGKRHGRSIFMISTAMTGNRKGREGSSNPVRLRILFLQLIKKGWLGIDIYRILLYQPLS